MSFSIIRKRWNKLDVTSPENFSNGQATSPEYNIGGAAKFQVSITSLHNGSNNNNNYNYIATNGMYTTKITFKFYKEKPANQRSYVIKLSSDDTDLDKNLKGEFHDDSSATSRIIYNGQRASRIWKFTLSITMETVNRMIIFDSLFEDSDLTDIELKGEDGNVAFHKAVLAAHSPFFMRLLRGEWKEVKQGYVELPKVQISTLHKLKQYMYLGKLPDEGLEELVVLASTYMISELEYRICEMILNNISNKNAYEMFQLAFLHNIPKLTIGLIKCIQLGIISGEEMEDLIAIREKANLVE